MEVGFFQIQVLHFLQAFAIAWIAVRLLSVISKGGVGRWKRRGERRWADLALIGALAAGLAVGISWLRPPLPGAHDEFSYLLAADTFSKGRLTNPTHPMWQHFETLHVIQQPTYASKYPPGQGLILALGQILTGNPVAGLWLSIALASAAVVWMLRAWMPRRWALLGGILTALHPGIQLVWTQSYWGGNVAFIGGALVLGAYGRLRRMPSCRDALWMAAGLAILANSRPLEGAMACLPVVLAVLAWPFRNRTTANDPLVGRNRSESPGISWRLWARRVILPLCSGLAVTATWMGYYNWRVTGNAWKMPYVVHEETYGASPVFLWQSAQPMPEYRHAEIRRVHAWLRATHSFQRSWTGYAGEKAVALVNLWHFYLGIALSIPFVALPWILRSHRYWMPTAMVAAVGAALLMTTWVNPHYAAPAGPALILLAVQGIRHLRIRTWRRAARGSLLVRALVMAQLIGFVPYAWFHVRQSPDEFPARRAEFVGRLKATPGRHLVLVRYRPDHNIHQDWVWNEAEIDAAKTVWARSMHSRADRRLTEYFSDRHIWLLSADDEVPQLISHEPRGRSVSQEAGTDFADREGRVERTTLPRATQ